MPPTKPFLSCLVGLSLFASCAQDDAPRDMDDDSGSSTGSETDPEAGDTAAVQSTPPDPDESPEATEARAYCDVDWRECPTDFCITQCGPGEGGCGYVCSPLWCLGPGELTPCSECCDPEDDDFDSCTAMNCGY